MTSARSDSNNRFLNLTTIGDLLVYVLIMQKTTKRGDQNQHKFIIQQITIDNKKFAQHNLLLVFFLLLLVFFTVVVVVVVRIVNARLGRFVVLNDQTTVGRKAKAAGAAPLLLRTFFSRSLVVADFGRPSCDDATEHRFCVKQIELVVALVARLTNPNRRASTRTRFAIALNPSGAENEECGRCAHQIFVLVILGIGVRVVDHIKYGIGARRL